MRRLVTDFVSVMRELSLDELHDEALLPPSLLVVGRTPERDRIVSDLLGPAATTYVTFNDTVPSIVGARYDAVIVVTSAPSDSELRRTLSSAESQGWPTVVLSTSNTPSTEVGDSVVVVPTTAGGDWTAARTRLVEVMDENRWLALGRYLPEMRPTVAATLVQATARANAQFATLSNLPAIIPLVGNIIGASADFLVLTKNQMLLLYKLAAVYGRDIDDRRQILIEMAPVVGAGLVWRTVARQLAALIPGLIGAVPKVLIAYTGTYTVGRAAQYYYEEGHRPTKADWDRFYQQAMRRWQAVWENLRRGQRQDESLTTGTAPAHLPPAEESTDHTLH